MYRFAYLTGLLGWALNCPAQSYETGFRQRASIIARQTADQYVPPPPTIVDPEKYYWPKAIARLGLYGPQDSLANAWIDQFRERSPFHFTLVGMARLMSQYPTAPALVRHKTQLLSRVFARTDGDNAWTGEGTENHITMARTSGYLFAQHALHQPRRFPQATHRLGQMRVWLDWKARQYYRLGASEWNSSTYGTYNIIGWLNLYDFARDRAVRNTARAVLDYYAAELALHYSYGSIGGAEMRGPGVGSGAHTATDYLGWLWFGVDEPNGFRPIGQEYIQCLHAITSRYRPPAPAIELARKRVKKPVMYRGSKPAYGLEEASFAKEWFYITPQYTLGTSMNRYGGWTGSTYQVVNWKLIVRPEADSLPVAISGNGRYYDNWTGKTRDPFTQWVQHNNIVMQLTKMPRPVDLLVARVDTIVNQWAVAWARDFHRRFPADTHKAGVVHTGEHPIRESASYLTLPKSVQLLPFPGGYCLQAGQVYVAVYDLSADRSIRVMDIPGNRLALLSQAAAGSLCGFVIDVSDSAEFSSLTAFQQAIQAQIPVVRENQVVFRTRAGDVIRATFQEMGAMLEATVDWGYGVTNAQIRLTYPTYHQPPWPVGSGFGRLPQWSVNGYPMDIQSPWPVYDGPELTLHHRALTLRSRQSVYRVDFRGRQPVFSSKPSMP